MILGFWSCGTLHKDYLGKAYRNITAYYNTYYNAKEIYNQDLKKIELANPDHYDRLLAFYKLGDEASATGLTGDMDIIIKKLSTLITRHERSDWVDDSYILMGKAYYLKGDYFSALDNFGYVYNTFPNDTLKEAALIWSARADIKLKKDRDAQSSLDLALSANPKSISKNNDELYSTAALFSLQNKDTLASLNYLSKAIKGSHNKTNKIRYHFIMAQLENYSNHMDSAKWHYEAILKLHPSYEISFGAQLGLANLLGNQDPVAERKLLYSYLKDDKNIEFQDQILYTLGKVSLNEGKLEEAIHDFNKSLQVSQGNVNQKGLNYEQLAFIYINKKKDYKQGSAYFDSTVTALDKDYPNYASLLKQKQKLSDLVANYIVIDQGDTLITFAGLDQNQKKLRVHNLIAAQIEKQKEDEIRAVQAYQKQLALANAQFAGTQVNPNQGPSQNSFFNTNGGIPGGGSSQNFYNPSSANQGQYFAQGANTSNVAGGFGGATSNSGSAYNSGGNSSGGFGTGGGFGNNGNTFSSNSTGGFGGNTFGNNSGNSFGNSGSGLNTASTSSNPFSSFSNQNAGITGTNGQFNNTQGSGLNGTNGVQGNNFGSGNGLNNGLSGNGFSGTNPNIQGGLNSGNGYNPGSTGSTNGLNNYGSNSPTGFGSNPNGLNSGSSGNSNFGSYYGGGGSGNFYFSNPVAMSSGYSQFLQKWGNRTLKDNWRASSRGGSIIGDNTQDSVKLSRNAGAVLESAGANPKKAEEKFLALIPQNDKQIDSIQERMISAHLSNAEIFDLDLKDYPKSINSYVEALKLKPDSSEKVQIYYNLYSLYNKLSDPVFNAQSLQELKVQGAPTDNFIGISLASEKAREYQEKITREFPKSNYATFFTHPELLYVNLKSDSILEKYYDSTYIHFLKHDFKKVMEEVKTVPVTTVRGNYLASKFEFLRTLSVGYTHPVGEFLVELKKMESRFPKDSLGLEAHRMIRYIDSNEAQFEFRPTALEYSPYENGFELAQRLQDQREAYLRHQREEAEKARKAYYKLDFDPPFQFLVLLKNQKVNLNTMRLNLSLFEQYNFNALHLKNQASTLIGKIPTMFIGTFPTIKSAISYYQKFEEQKTDLIGLPEKQFEYYFISSANFEKLKDTASLNIYREFFNEFMLPYTSTVAPKALPNSSLTDKKQTEKLEDKPVIHVPSNFSFVKTGNFLVTAFIKNTRMSLNSIRLKLSLYNQANFGDKNLRQTSNFVDNQFQSLTVGYFPSLDAARSYYAQLIKSKEDVFPISSSDLDIVIINQENLQKIKTRDIESDYLSFFDKNLKTP